MVRLVSWKQDCHNEWPKVVIIFKYSPRAFPLRIPALSETWSEREPALLQLWLQVAPKDFHLCELPFGFGGVADRSPSRTLSMVGH
jgi:hypothetical protein